MKQRINPLYLMNRAGHKIAQRVGPNTYVRSGGTGSKGFTENPGTIVLPIEDGSLFTFQESGGGAGSKEDSTLSKTGNGSVKWTTDAGVGNTRLLKFDAFNIDMTKAQNISFWIYADSQGVSETNRFETDIAASVSSLATYLFKSDSSTITYPGWNVSEYHSSEYGENGEVWSAAMRTLRFVCYARAGRSQIYHMDSMIIGHRARPKVIFTLDDATESQYTVAWTDATYGARDKGITLSLAIIPSLLDTAGYMTTAQVNEMYAAGCDVILHDDQRWDKLATQQALTDYINNRRSQYASWPRSLDLAAYPEGRFGLDADATLTPFEVYQGLLDAGVTTSRTTAALLQPTMPQGKPHSINVSGINLNSGTTLAAAKAFIDTAELRGQTCIFYGHSFGAVAGGSFWKDSDLGELYDYAIERQSAGALDIMSFSGWAQHI